LKNKFSTGYTIELKIAEVPETDLWSLVKQFFDEDGYSVNLHLSTTLGPEVIDLIMAQVAVHTDKQML
jgi:hypothetical protein